MSVPQLPCLRALTIRMRKRIFTPAFSTSQRNICIVKLKSHPLGIFGATNNKIYIQREQFWGEKFSQNTLPVWPLPHCLTHACRLGCLISCLITNRTAGINAAWKNSSNSAAAIFLYELLLFLFLGKACPVHNLSFLFSQYSLFSCAPSFQLFCQCPPDTVFTVSKAAAYIIGCWDLWLLPMYLWSLSWEMSVMGRYFSVL